MSERPGESVDAVEGPAPAPGAPPPAPSPPAQGFTARYKQLLGEYGPLAIAVYLTIFFSVWGGACAMISLGLDLPALLRRVGIDLGGGSSVGATVTLGYGVAKATQVLRILATLALTPLVARWLGRAPAAAEDSAPEAGASSPPTTE